MENSRKFFKNTGCEYLPCHDIQDKEGFNCMFCFCPLYGFAENCGGNFTYSQKGVKICTDCSLPHTPENYDAIIEKLKEANK